jgi:hypothetical protein
VVLNFSPVEFSKKVFLGSWYGPKGNSLCKMTSGSQSCYERTGVPNQQKKTWKPLQLPGLFF